MKKIGLATFFLLGLLVASLILVSTANAQEGQVTLHPIHDAYTNTKDPETNYGNAPYLKLANTDAYTRFVWLRFNLSEVPEGAVITSATLELYPYVVVHIFEPETYNVSAHFCSDNTWNEFTITHHNQPEYNNTAASWTLIETPDQWYTWDVTYAAKRQANGVHGGEDEVTIFMQENLHHRDGFNIIFFSKECDARALAYIPKLTVRWGGIIPEFPSWTSMLLLLVTIVALIAIHKQKRVKNTQQIIETKAK